MKNSRKTLIITGPGGIGKSPLDELLLPKSKMKRIEPLRHRENPRENDIWYAPDWLPKRLEESLKILGDKAKNIGNAKTEKIRWFQKSRIVMFTVRGVWQTLFLPAQTNMGLIKMEIYAPVLWELLKISDFKKTLGDIRVLILNPSEKSLLDKANPNADKEIAKMTEINCQERGDAQDKIDARVKSVKEEAPFWRELLERNQTSDFRSFEITGWEYPEWKFKNHKKEGEKEFDSFCNKAKESLLTNTKLPADFGIKKFFP